MTTISWSLLLGCAIGYSLGVVTAEHWLFRTTTEQMVRSIVAVWTIVLCVAIGSMVTRLII